MDYNVNKICRVCLEEGALTSIYSTEFAMMPCAMMAMCAKIRVYKTDGLPSVICNNCIYRLGVAYHFKQECESSDIRLRQYLGLPDRGYGLCDAETNTEIPMVQLNEKTQAFLDQDSEDELAVGDNFAKKSKRRTRYQRKPPEEHKKRGPKPIPKLPQTCYDCNKTFKCAAQLQMHLRTHTGEKPFSCNYCSRRFAQKYNLQIHIRSHTGERPFQCEVCSKQFAALGNFQAHQKIHSGVRDTLCPVCQKAFYSAGDLSKHMITHTGIKSHHCDVCGKTFSRQRDMVKHKRKLHAMQERSEEDDGDEAEVDTADPVVVVGSPDCDKEFASSSNLSVHFRTHSGNNLLNLPLVAAQMPHAHHHHHYHPPPPPPPTGTSATHVLNHEALHPPPHAHHLPLNATVGTLQSNAVATTGMPMSHHATMAHILPPSSPPASPTGQSALSMMHVAQRLHPY